MTTSVTDTVGYQTRTSYTSDDLPAATSEFFGAADQHHHTDTTYDPNGNVTATRAYFVARGTVDAKDLVTTFAYNADDTVASQSVADTDPTGGATTNTWRWGYDPVGNTVSTHTPSAVAADATNPAGRPRTATFTHDNLVATMTTPVDPAGTTARVECPGSSFLDRSGWK